jgi:transposase
MKMDKGFRHDWYFTANAARLLSRIWYKYILLLIVLYSIFYLCLPSYRTETFSVYRADSVIF